MPRLYVKTAGISTSPIAHLGERSYLQLDVELTETQAREAIIALLNTMPEERALQWLSSEFPDWCDSRATPRKVREAAQASMSVMANARDFLHLEYFNQPTNEWNADTQAAELQQALLNLNAALK